MNVFPVTPPVPNPGINVNLGPQGPPGISSVVPGFDLLPNSAAGVVGLANAMGFGNPENEITGLEFVSDTDITHSYTIVPWSDHSELHITSLQPVFASRYVDKRNSMTNIVSVFKLTQLMKDKHDMFNERVRLQAPKEMSFKRFLETHGEQVLREYDMLLNSSDREHAAEMARIVNAEGGADVISLEQAHKLASQDDCRFETLFGILKHWNFLGVVSSTGESTGNGSYMDSHANSSMIKTAAVILGEKARCANVFSGSRREYEVGSKCFFVIRRAYGQRDAPFQIEALALKSRSAPQAAESYYVASNGEETPGHVICVGTVSERGNHTADSTQQAIALGTGAQTLEQARTAMTNLPTLYLQLGI